MRLWPHNDKFRCHREYDFKDQLQNRVICLHNLKLCKYYQRVAIMALREQRYSKYAMLAGNRLADQKSGEISTLVYLIETPEGLCLIK